MEISIRDGKLEDTKQVQDIARTTWKTTYDEIIPLETQEAFLKENYSSNSIKLRIERSLLYVAEVNEEVIGFANFSKIFENGIVELAAIYIYPKYQGKGIGSALLKHGIQNIQGMKKLYINVGKENVIGRTFYTAKKFVIVKEFESTLEGNHSKMLRMVLSKEG